MRQNVSHPENALAYFTLFAFCIASLADRLGELGKWISIGLHAVLGNGAWAVPVWLINAAWRSLVGLPWDLRHGLGAGVALLIACTTFGLFGAEGGWVGMQFADGLTFMIGKVPGAYMVVGGFWLVGFLRMLGQERVQRLTEHVAEFSHRALEQVRPVLTLHARPLAATGALPPPLPRAPVPALAADNQQSPSVLRADPERAITPVPEHVSAPTKRPSMSSHWTLPGSALIRAPKPHIIDHSWVTAVVRDLGIRLQSYGINAAVEKASVQGALLYKFEITPAASQDIKPIMALQVNFEAAYKGFRFVSMPGTGKLGVEIAAPKEQRGEISIRAVLESRAWLQTDAALPIVLGVTTSGEPVVVDLAACPHLLVAGTTGSGKSVGVNVILTSLLLRNSPDELELLLLDPKRVELARYKGLPHLIAPPITEVNEMVKMLQWACREMDDRYGLFESEEVTDIESFNDSKEGKRKKLTRIVIVIDEYADLKSVVGKVVEEPIIRLAQKARAAGIHVIAATQRPSVDIITGAIKANFPSRIAYKVAQREDSKTIIGASGAQLLLGKGDSMCLIPELSTELVRVHGAFIHPDDTKAICAAWRNQTSQTPAAAKPVYVEEPAAPAKRTSEPASVEIPPVTQAERQPVALTQVSRRDELYEQAVALARQKGCISARQITEELHCNNQNAKRVFERMREQGLIKPGGQNNTHVFVTEEAKQGDDECPMTQAC